MKNVSELVKESEKIWKMSSLRIHPSGDPLCRGIYIARPINNERGHTLTVLTRFCVKFDLNFWSLYSTQTMFL